MKCFLEPRPIFRAAFSFRALTEEVWREAVQGAGKRTLHNVTHSMCTVDQLDGDSENVSKKESALSKLNPNELQNVT